MYRLSRFLVLTILVFAFFLTSCGTEESKGPSEDVLHYRKGRELYNLKVNYRENRLKAHNEFKKVVNIYPESHLAPEALYYMIKISELYRSPAETLALLRRMMNEFPHNNYQEEVKTKLADLLCQEAAANIGAFRQTEDLKAMNQAMEQLREARKVKPGFQRAEDTLKIAYNITGDWYEAKEEIRPAIKNYEQAVKDAPDWGYGYLRLARLYDKAGETENAIRHYENATKYLKAFSVYSPLGKLYLKTEAFQNAAEAFEKAVEVVPHSEDAYRDLAQAYSRLGEQEKSKKALDQAEHIKKWGYADRGKHEEDVAGWIEAIGNDPKPVYYYNLAALYESQGDKKNAHQYFKTYKGRAKDEEFKAEEKKYLKGIQRRIAALKKELDIRKCATTQTTSSEAK